MKAALIVWSDGQGDMSVHLVTPELYARMQEQEVHHAFDLLYCAEDKMDPGVLKTFYCQNGVFEKADLTGYEICGILVDEIA
jgi:hypothetical protein